MAAKMARLSGSPPLVTITTWRMPRNALSRVLQHDTKLGFDLPLNRSLKPAKARGAGERFECTVALLFGKRKAGFGIAALGRFVADQKRDRRPLISRGLSGRECAVDQGLHQPASAIRGQRRNMLNQPVAGATLYPAARGVGAPLKDGR